MLIEYSGFNQRLTGMHIRNFVLGLRSRSPDARLYGR